MLKIFEKIFGSKHDKDIKKIQPLIQRINELQASFDAMSDEQLKAKGAEIRGKVRGTLQPIEQKKSELIAALGEPDIDLDKADAINDELDGLAKEYEKATAAVLDEVLPETFAVVKDTCRRLKGHTYTVMGHEMTWDMVPYDVQLIGGIV
ncbi:MAG: preprotein translocase subunit SecA, partial [Chlorobiaceae bacterium]|nr:preprotein translocase subunit SecA [Chlorobiaceae bacterium]